MNDIVIGGIYYHFKGRFYKVIGITKNSENSDDMVIYKALYGDEETYVRPKTMFTEQVDANGTMIDRFHHIDTDAIRRAYVETSGGVNVR